MALNKRLISTGSPICATEVTDIFGDSSGLALYSFDYDASGASGYYSGTANNIAFGVQGKTNTGARFNGDNSRITLPAISAIPTNSSPNKSYSVSFWINSTTARLNGTSGTYRSGEIFGFYDDTYAMIGFGGNTNGNFPAGKLFYYNYGGSGQRNNWIITPNSYADGNYHHVVVTDEYVSSGNTRNRKLYVDGSLIVSDNQANTWYAGGGGNTIGSANTSNQLNADLDQVRIFSKALGQTEINTLYNSGSGEIACVHTATTTNIDFPVTNAAYYELDNSAEDSHSGTYNGTESNIEYRFGRYGQAAVFNGSNSIITATQPSGINGPCSYSIWLKTTSSSYQSIITTGSISGSHTAGVNLFVNSGKLSCQTGNGSNTENTAINSTSNVDTGNWVHCVVTVAGSAQGSAIKIYINGVNETSGTADNTAIVTATGEKLCLGGRILSGSQSTFLNGSLDQARIFTSALSAANVLKLAEEKPETDTSNFKAVLYKGTGANQYISNVGMDLETSGGLVWIKSRDSVSNHDLIDSVRGATKVIESDANYAEFTEAGNLQSFEANGFFVGNVARVNKANDKMVSWVFKGGGAAVNIGVNSITGSTPSIASTVSANSAAGFSIVRNTGTSNYSDTIGHGLSQAPQIIIQKGLSSSVDWYVLFNIDGTGTWDYGKLNNTQAFAPDNPVRFSANSTTINNWGWTNYDMINYCWHSVAGYSKIGTYTGSGATSGKIITTGFEPSWVMFKPTSAAGYWYILDNKRSTTNPRNDGLFPNDSLAEIESTNYNVDFLSNGFELKNNTIGFNQNNVAYLYMAFK